VTGNGHETGSDRARLHPDEVVSSLGEHAQAAAELLAAVGVVSRREFEAGGMLSVKGVDELLAAGACTPVRVDDRECYALTDELKAAVLRDLGQERRAALQASAAQLRESLGVLDCGLQLAWQRRDWMACSRIIDRWWPQLGFSSARPLSQRVMAAMPPEALRAWPGTWHRAEYIGILPLGEAPVDVPTDPEQINELCRTGEAWLVLRRSAIAMNSRRVHGRFEEARQIAIRALPIAESVGWAAHGFPRGFSAFWFLHAGISHELAGDFSSAARLYRSGWEARHNDELGFCARDLAGKLSASAALRGDRDDALTWLGEARAQPATDLWIGPHIETALDIAELMLAVDELDGSRARAHDDRLARPVHREGYWSMAAFARARRLVTWSHPYDAVDLLDDAERMEARTVDGVHRVLLGSARADAMLAAGHATRALTVLEGMRDTGFGVVTRARIALLAGQPDEASAQVSVALEGSLWPRARTELMLIGAAAAAELGDVETGARTMVSVIARIDQHRDLRALATVPRQVLVDLAPRVPRLAALVAELEDARVAPIYPDAVELVTISARESAVLKALSDGQTLAEAAAQLVVSPNTVKTQVRSLYAKLDVRERRDLLVEARRLGLLLDHDRRLD